MSNFSNRSRQATLYDSPADQTDSVKGSGQQNAPVSSLPPFDVLLSWLSYAHAQTGEWPLPPGQAMAAPTDTGKILPLNRDVTVQPPAGGSSRPDTSFARREQVGAAEQAGIEFPPTKKQSTGRQLQKEKARLELVDTHPAEIESADLTTDFNYVNSVYFTEALHLLGSWANRPVNPELAVGCQLTLSLIIAWCHFPLFNGMSNRQGRWMALATRHFTRELGMRTGTLKIYLAELVELGLISCGQAEGAIISSTELNRLRADCNSMEHTFGPTAASFWNTRTVQAKTTIYRLDEEIEFSQALPVFEPFSGPERFDTIPARPGKTSIIEMTSGKTRQDPARLATQTGNAKGSFPVLPCINKIHDDGDDKFSDAPVSQLRLEQAAKLDFLTNRAIFKDYQHSTGRTTLAPAEALKFALNDNLSLESLTERYEQVAEMWGSGHCRKNPLGLLHWAITNDCDPRGESDPPPGKANFAAGQLYERAKSDYQKARPSQENSYRPRRKYERAKPTPDPSYRFGVAAEIAPVVEVVPTDRVWLSKSLAEVAELWQEMQEIDLEGRYNLPAHEAALLEDSYLDFFEVEDSPAPQAIIVLRSAIEENQLSMSSRRLIQMALRQKTGPGYELRFSSRE